MAKTSAFLKCEICAAPFAPRQARITTCSAPCSAEKRRRYDSARSHARRLAVRTPVRPCGFCGREVEQPFGQQKHYCDDACWRAERSRRGRDARATRAAAPNPAKTARPLRHPRPRPVIPRGALSVPTTARNAAPVVPARPRRPTVLPPALRPLWADLGRLRITPGVTREDFAALHLRAAYAAETLTAAQDRAAADWLRYEAREEARRR